ncbi:MAG: hypothetical protein QM742_17590 [Aquabacterium sp.]
MNVKSLAALAAAVIASTSAYAGAPKDQKCGAGSCGKKTHVCKDGDKEGQACEPKEAGKEASCSKKDAGCSKKEAGCSKKDAGCSKK